MPWQDRHKVILAVFLIFRKEQEVLLLKRTGTEYMNGFYSLPAGHVDGNEAAIVAACREAKEEVGVEIDPKDLRLVHTMHELAEGHERLNLGFEVLKYEGDLYNAEPHKHGELRWADPADLPTNTVPQVKAIFQNVAANAPYSSYGFNE